MNQLAREGARFTNFHAQDREREWVEELYDLEADVGERNNLAAKHPEKVSKLEGLMEALAKRTLQ